MSNNLLINDLLVNNEGFIIKFNDLSKPALKRINAFVYNILTSEDLSMDSFNYIQVFVNKALILKTKSKVINLVNTLRYYDLKEAEIGIRLVKEMGSVKKYSTMLIYVDTNAVVSDELFCDNDVVVQSEEAT